MSAPAANIPAANATHLPAASATRANCALYAGIAGLAATVIGLAVSGNVHAVAMSYLVGISYWTTIAIGMLMLVLIHHIFDAGWSVVIRRQFEHGLAAFKWLFVLFLPLVATAFIGGGDTVWPWMNPAHELLHGHGTVATDILYQKKGAFLNVPMFVGATLVFFAVWIWLSARLRKASFAQDTDGSAKWTTMNRKTAAFGIPLLALSLSFAAIYWIKSLEYHWFSTMYGVYYFAASVWTTLATLYVITTVLQKTGPLAGVITKRQRHDIGVLWFAFTVFYSYIHFSQYFLIYNANIPEETYYYVKREVGTWWQVGMVIIFGHFLVPNLMQPTRSGGYWV